MLSVYLNMLGPLGPRTGFILCGACLMLGSLFLFFMPYACKHRSNHEVIQRAHFNSKSYEDEHMLYGMEISGDADSLKHNNISFMYPYIHPSFKHRPLPPHPDLSSKCSARGLSRGQLGLITEEDCWSDLDGMSPMSPTDKVTEFLVHSQTMLQNYSQLHRIDLPAVRLEINNEYSSGGSASDYAHVNHLETVNIKELKLEATLFHRSPKKKKKELKNNMLKNFSDGGSPLSPSNPLGEHSPDISPLVERVSTFPRNFTANHVSSARSEASAPTVTEKSRAVSGYRYYGNSMKNLRESMHDHETDYAFTSPRGPRPAKSVPLLVTCEKTTTV